MNRLALLAFLFCIEQTTVIGETDVWQRFDYSSHGMGTHFRCAFFAIDKEAAERAFEECQKRFHELDKMLTDYDTSSELMRLCDDQLGYPRHVSLSLYDVLRRALEIAEWTDGAFDPSGGHLSQLWRRAHRKHQRPAEKDLDRAWALTDWRRITMNADSQSVSLEPKTLLDLGGIAKGFAADQCLRILKEHHFSMAVVQIGGDTAVGDPPPDAAGWKIQLTNGEQDSDVERTKEIVASNCGVSTSGDRYQRIELDGQSYSHIHSKKARFGLVGRLACSVQASDCTTSDALATAMCSMTPIERERLLENRPEIKFWLLAKDR